MNDAPIRKGPRIPRDCWDQLWWAWVALIVVSWLVVGGFVGMLWWALS